MIKVPSLELTLDVSFDTEREQPTFLKRLERGELAHVIRGNEELTFRKHRSPPGSARHP